MTTKPKAPAIEPEKVTPPAKNKAAAQPQRLIYCGPNIAGGALQKYAVFKGGTPTHLGGLFEKCPAIKELFVPVSELATTVQGVTTKGTRLNALYVEVASFAQKGGA